MISHTQARIFATAGFQSVFNRKPSLSEVQCLQAVGGLETSYGAGWKKPEAVGSHNIGAIIAGGNWKGETFEHADSMPNADGTNRWYTTKFRKYPSPAEGWADLARIMYANRPSVLEAAIIGDVYAVSAAMYETRYFFGTGKDSKTRISRHHAAMLRNLVAQCRELGEMLPGGEELPRRTLKRGFTGEDVADVQRALGITADRQFGPMTENAVKEFQRSRGLKDDGQVGPLTWEELDNFQDAEASNLEALCAKMRTAKATFDSTTA